MKEKCDLYLPYQIIGNREWSERILRIYPKAILEEGRPYSGFLGINIDRLSAVSMVTEFRKRKIPCFNVPIAYRDGTTISVDEAIAFARKNTGLVEANFTADHRSNVPLWWSLISDALPNAGEGGGRISIDRLDGHVWRDYETGEYMYDYNNLL
jgi:hypothetical protein